MIESSDPPRHWSPWTNARRFALFLLLLWMFPLDAGAQLIARSGSPGGDLRESHGPRLARKALTSSETGPRRRAHRKDHRTRGELLVRHGDGASEAIDRDPSLAGLVRARSARGRDRLILRFDEEDVDIEALSQRLRALPGVLDVEPNLILETQAPASTRDRAPDYARKQWHWRRSAKRERWMERQARRSGAAATTVCVLDTGLDLAHPEFAGRVAAGANVISDPGPDEPSDSEQDFNGHGTRVAGIIAAADDGAGTVGVNPHVRICGIKAFDRDGVGTLEDVIAGIEWAITQRIDVLNMSFGTYEHSALLADAIARAAEAGLLLIAAAGNDAAEAAMYPARFSEVLAIGSHEEDGRISVFSNWGEEVDLFAPGDRVLTTGPSQGREDSTVAFHGTSASAAFVSGIASLLLDEGQSSRRVGRILQRDVIRRVDALAPGGTPYDAIDSRSILARLLREPFADWTLTRLEIARSVFDPEDDLEIAVRVQNTGTRATQATAIQLRVYDAVGTTEPRGVILSEVPALEPGASFAIDQAVPLAALMGGASLGDDDTRRLRLELTTTAPTETPALQRDILVTRAPRESLKVRRLWVNPLDFHDDAAERTLHVLIENDGNQPMRDLTLDAWAVAAVHEGVGRAPRISLGTQPIDALAPGEVTRVSLDLVGFVVPEHHVTFGVEVDSGERLATRFLQGYTHASEAGHASPQYIQGVHRAVVEEAVDLLAAQGIYIEDLHAPNSPYRGSAGSFNQWPGTIGLPTTEWTLSGWWTDERLVSGPVTLALSDFTLIDGAHDADAVDIAFGYSFEDNFDSHFWIVDQFDDDGLDSAGSNHHSALSKMRALLYGRGGGAPSDSRLDHGAIAHYRAGHKKAAWWFLGHAAHLIGDLSVPAHVDNENYHGATGATYHGWMDSGEYLRWNWVDAYLQGGTFDPYVAANLGDPARYLTYTTAQIGNAFSWAETIGTQGGWDGNRVAGGDHPHYESTVYSLFAQLAPRPLVKWHVNKDEIYDNFWGECQLVDWVSPLESRRDCWGGGDGHVDYDNTDDGGSNADGDMMRIGEFNYPFAMRAIAGLIYYFATETNQIGPCSGRDYPLGDANLDGVVNGADYTIWADHFGLSPATVSQGDFNCDDRVDGGDYTIWSDNFGAGQGAAAASGGGGSVAAESPSSGPATPPACGLGFEIVVVCGLLSLARRRRAPSA